MQPRKSSAFSSLPDAVAPPLDLTDLAICLKYLILWCNHLSHTFSMHLNQNLQRMCQTYLRLISFKTTDGCCVTYLPIPLNPLISFSFLQASATETSSSWSLGRKITHFFSVRTAEMTVLILKDICWCILPYVQMEQVIVNIINVTVEKKHI